jgi:hypothetical protein
LTGEPLTPLFPATASAQRDGAIGAEHVTVIRQLFHQLPDVVDIETREHAEKHLASNAARFRPDQLAKLARRLMDCLNPDGTYTDEDRARARGLVFGNQQADGMSKLTGWLRVGVCLSVAPWPAWNHPQDPRGRGHGGAHPAPSVTGPRWSRKALLQLDVASGRRFGRRMGDHSPNDFSSTRGTQTMAR